MYAFDLIELNGNDLRREPLPRLPPAARLLHTWHVGWQLDETRRPDAVQPVVSRWGQVCSLLDRRVGAGEEHGRDFEPECLRSPEIDCQLVFRWLLDRHFG